MYFHFTDVDLSEKFKNYHRDKINLRLIKKVKNTIFALN